MRNDLEDDLAGQGGLNLIKQLVSIFVCVYFLVKSSLFPLMLPRAGWSRMDLRQSLSPSLPNVGSSTLSNLFVRTNELGDKVYENHFFCLELIFMNYAHRLLLRAVEQNWKSRPDSSLRWNWILRNLSLVYVTLSDSLINPQCFHPPSQCFVIIYQRYSFRQVKHLSDWRREEETRQREKRRWDDQLFSNQLFHRSKFSN